MDAQKRFIFYHLKGIHDDPTLADGYLRSTALFLDLLREKGVYDNSYIVFLGDHGIHEIEEYHHNPFLMIKKPGQKFEQMKENDEIVLIQDIAPTILYDMNLADKQKVYSLWNFSPDQKKVRAEFWLRLMETKGAGRNSP